MTLFNWFRIGLVALNVILAVGLLVETRKTRKARHYWEELIEERKIITYTGICATMPETAWMLRFEKKCYFYEMRDCPGWAPGTACGRIGDMIPTNAQEES